jgi:predicted secreted protein
MIFKSQIVIQCCAAVGILIFFSALWAAPFSGVEAESDRAPESEGGSVISVNIRDNGREIRVKKGKVIEIELKTLGTAGYSWFFDGLESEYFEVGSEKTKPLSERMGAPVAMVWQVRAKKAGTANIDMYNYRVWEGKGKAVNRFSLKVIIY